MTRSNLPPRADARGSARPAAATAAGAARRLACACFAMLGLLSTARVAPGQPLPLPEVSPPPYVVNKIGVDQKLGDAIPLDLSFRDDAGRDVRLGDYFGGDRPVVLLLVYYECPSLCNQVLNGVTGAMKAIGFDAGKEFDVVAVSIDPDETPDLAAKKKEAYLNLYGRPRTAGGWHFLTGGQPAIDALAGAVGFRYAYDEGTAQYAHAAVVFVATPAGRLSRYLFGIEYAPNDLRLALVEAADGRIGSVVDQVMLACYQYNPATGRYGLVIMRALRGSAVLLVVGLAVAIAVWLRRERRGAGGPTTTTTGAAPVPG